MKRKWKIQWRSVLEKKNYLCQQSQLRLRKPRAALFYRNSVLFTRDSCLDLFKYETLLEDVSKVEDRKTRG